MIVPVPRDMVPPIPIKCDKILLVEGSTPAHFFEALLMYLERESVIEIRNYGSIANLGNYLKTLASTAEFRARVKTLGIARDAVNDPEAAMRSVKSAIQAANMSENITVEVAILPDGRSKGMIETLFLRSVENLPEFACISQFWECARNCGIALPEGEIRAKHITQLYLATRPEAQMMPGIASYKGAWPLGHGSFEHVRQFLRTLTA